MFNTDVNNIRFAIYLANCCGSLPLNVNVVSIYSIELETNHAFRLLEHFCRSCKLKVKNGIINIGMQETIRAPRNGFYIYLVLQSLR